MPAGNPTKRRTSALKILGRSGLTLAVAGMAGAALVVGVGLLQDRAAAVPGPEAAAPVSVLVQPVRFEDGYDIQRRFTGQIEARAEVSLSFELDGRLEALDAREGDAVQAGQELARLDTDLLEAEKTRLQASRNAASAQLTFAESRLARALQLQDQGFASQETLDQALAARDELASRIAETDAALRSVAIRLGKSVLHAPFSGQVAAQEVETSETVQAGQRIVTIVETDKPEVRIGLPLDVGPDALNEVEIEVNGVTYPATLKALRPDIDPVTRTRTALFELAPAADTLFGQTAILVLDTPVRTKGIWLPLDALQAGNGSVWTVMVAVDDKLRRASVELLHVEGSRAFVQGSLAADDLVVVSGAHRVVPGQSVQTTMNTGG